MQKILCPHCYKIMGGESSTSRNGIKHTYYKCHACNKRIKDTIKVIDKNLETGYFKYNSSTKNIDFFENLENEQEMEFCFFIKR